MRYPIITIFILVIISDSNSQSRILHKLPCSKTIYIKSKLWETYPDSLYSEAIIRYFKNNYPNDLNHYTEDVKTLEPIPKEYCLDSEVKFKSTYLKDTIEITIKTEKLSFNIDRKIINNDYYLNINKVISDSLGMNIYGFIPDDIDIPIYKFQFISLNIKDKHCVIPLTLYQDLINPNICYNYGSLKPIETYFSETGDELYIYIMGNTKIYPDYPLENHLNASFSYVSKLIIPINDPIKSKRIIVPGGFLIHYGWIDCLEFWTF